MDVADLVHAGGGRDGVAVMKRWLAAPPVHFVLLGSLLFALQAGRPSARADEAGAAPRAATDAELLEREARRLGLERDDSAVQRRLLRNLRFLGEAGADDAGADFEEALALGLDRSDRVVRRRLVQRFELRAQAWARASEPTPAELAALLERESGRFALPERTRLSHVFVSRDRHADLAAADAALAQRLPTLAPERAAELGDPFLLGNRLEPRTRAELAASFGDGFAGAVEVLPPGRWSAPIESSYGLHRVFVHERIPARAARLEEVRDAVREAVFAERAERVLADWLRELRSEAS